LREFGDFVFRVSEEKGKAKGERKNIFVCGVVVAERVWYLHLI